MSWGPASAGSTSACDGGVSTPLGGSARPPRGAWFQPSSQQSFPGDRDRLASRDTRRRRLRCRGAGFSRLGNDCRIIMPAALVCRAMPIQYTDPNADVPPGVDFLDAEQARSWVAACELDKPWRVPMRLRFAELIAALPPNTRVLELGSGPGLLAECILEHSANIASYTLLDFSEHMRRLSSDRVSRFSQTQFVNANFRSPDWIQALEPPYSAVVAMQAVHEIRHKRHVPGLYRQLRQVLSPGGMVAVCDGTPRDAGLLWHQSLFLTRDEQLNALAAAGFTDVRLDKAIGNTILVVGRVSG